MVSDTAAGTFSTFGKVPKPEQALYMLMKHIAVHHLFYHINHAHHRFRQPFQAGIFLPCARNAPEFFHKKGATCEIPVPQVYYTLLFPVPLPLNVLFTRHKPTTPGASLHTISPRRFGLPDLALLITCACWGLNFVVTKSATADGPENFRLFIFNLIRFPAASILLFITARFMGEKLGVERRYLAAIAGLSFVGNFLYQIFYMVGQYLTSAVNVGVVYGFTPLIIVLLSVTAGIERATVFIIGGVFVGFVGLCMVMSGGGGSYAIDTGALLMLIAGCCWAVYAVFGKKILDRYPPVVTTAWMLLFGGLYQLPLALWQLPHQSWTTLSAQSILFVALSAIFSLYTGYTLFYYAVLRIGPARSGIYSNLTPVFTLIFASLIRGEDILPKHIIGLAVIIIGIAVTKIRLGERRAVRELIPEPQEEKGV